MSTKVKSGAAEFEFGLKRTVRGGLVVHGLGVLVLAHGAEVGGLARGVEHPLRHAH